MVGAVDPISVIVVFMVRVFNYVWKERRVVTRVHAISVVCGCGWVLQHKVVKCSLS